MPPVPTPSPAALTSSITRRIADIRNYQVSRMRLCTGPITLHQQYAAEMREDIESVQRSLKSLEVLADDEERESDREKAHLAWSVLDKDLNELKKESRAAMLFSKRAIDATASRLLFDEVKIPEHRDPTKKTDDPLMDKSNEVTLALQRTMQLMQQEVERSVLSTQMLEESSRTIQATTTSYGTLSSLLNTSKALITALEKADWMDRALIFAALAFFLLVVGFILKQRIIDRSFRLAFWWVKYLPSFGDEGLDLDVMEKGAASVITSVLTTAAAVSTSLLGKNLQSSATGGDGALEMAARTATVPEPTASVGLQSGVDADNASFDSLVSLTSSNLSAPTSSSSLEELAYEEGAVDDLPAETEDAVGDGGSPVDAFMPKPEESAYLHAHGKDAPVEPPEPQPEPGEMILTAVHVDPTRSIYRDEL